jgi:uncharacterized protein YcfL
MRFTAMHLLFFGCSSTPQGRLIELSVTDDHPVANFHIDNPVLAAARDKNKRARFAQD